MPKWLGSESRATHRYSHKSIKEVICHRIRIQFVSIGAFQYHLHDSSGWDNRRGGRPPEILSSRTVVSRPGHDWILLVAL